MSAAAHDPNSHVLDTVIVPGESWDWNFLMISRVSWHPVTKHMLLMMTSALIVFLLFLLYRLKTRDGLVPRGRFVNMLESLIDLVRKNIVERTMGHHGHAFEPFFLTLFFFILVNNLIGAIPRSATPTGNFAVTLGLATVVFLTGIVAGVAAQGPVKFVVNLAPVLKPAWLNVLYPLLFAIELLGLVIKHGVLAIRLYANMIAGHIVIFSILILATSAASMAAIGLPLALFISLMEVGVAFLQAYIFTLLACIFIGNAVHPHH